MAVHGGKGAYGVEKGGKQTFIPGAHEKEDECQYYLLLKMRGAEFREFLKLVGLKNKREKERKPVGLKAWNFKNQGIQLWESLEGLRKHSLCP